MNQNMTGTVSNFELVDNQYLNESKESIQLQDENKTLREENQHLQRMVLKLGQNNQIYRNELDRMQKKKTEELLYKRNEQCYKEQLSNLLGSIKSKLEQRKDIKTTQNQQIQQRTITIILEEENKIVQLIRKLESVIDGLTDQQSQVPEGQIKDKESDINQFKEQKNKFQNKTQTIKLIQNQEKKEIVCLQDQNRIQQLELETQKLTNQNQEIYKQLQQQIQQNQLDFQIICNISEEYEELKKKYYQIQGENEKQQECIGILNKEISELSNCNKEELKNKIGQLLGKINKMLNKNDQNILVNQRIVQLEKQEQIENQQEQIITKGDLKTVGQGITRQKEVESGKQSKQTECIVRVINISQYESGIEREGVEQAQQKN